MESATPSAGGPGQAVRVSPGREAADEWAVVLAAAGIEHWLRHRLDGWALLVSPRDVALATAALDAYDRENASGPADAAPVAVAPGAMELGVAVAVLLLLFFVLTGPRAADNPWFERGAADSGRIVAGEWWRAVTALTLHADGPHVLGNAVAAALLLPAVLAELGPGVGLALVLLTGAGGNLITAAVQGAGYVSVGASTAIFGALGVLAALSLVRRARSRARKRWVIVAAGLALLALLGTAPDADLMAHLFGMLVGAALGLVAGLARRPIGPPALQWTLVAAVAAVVLAAWRAAF